MSDETKTDDMPDIDPNASKADLKAAADEMLKKAGREQAAEAMAAFADAEAEAAGETPPEDQPQTDAQQIQVLEAEKQEMKDQLLRAMAEVQNVRRRAEKDISDARNFAIERFAGDLLSVSDNMSRALQALSGDDLEGLSEPGKNLLGGVEMTQKELHTVLQRHGVQPIDAQPGDTFDPNLHQAVANIPSDQPSGTIAELFQAGWKIGDRPLRAAMVAVSAGAAN